MASLLELPSELLEHRVCQYLDVSSVTQLGLVNHRLQNDITNCSEIWKTLVARHFGYMHKTPLTGPKETAEIKWRAVFVAAWGDSLALAHETVQESDVLRVYHQQVYTMLLQPHEVQVRQEIVLMQGLRRIPMSVKLVHLYAEVIRQAHLVPRLNAAGSAKALRRLAL